MSMWGTVPYVGHYYLGKGDTCVPHHISNIANALMEG